MRFSQATPDLTGRVRGWDAWLVKDGRDTVPLCEYDTTRTAILDAKLAHRIHRVLRSSVAVCCARYRRPLGRREAARVPVPGGIGVIRPGSGGWSAGA